MAEYESDDDIDDMPPLEDADAPILPSSSTATATTANTNDALSDALRRQRLDNAYSEEALAKRIRVAKKKKKDYMGLEPKLRAQLEAAQQEVEKDDERKTHRKLLADHKQILTAGKVDYVKMTPMEQMAAKLGGGQQQPAATVPSTDTNDDQIAPASDGSGAPITTSVPLSTANPLSLLSPSKPATVTVAASPSPSPSLPSKDVTPAPSLSSAASAPPSAASAVTPTVAPAAVVDLANKVDDVAAVVDDLFASDDDEPSPPPAKPATSVVAPSIEQAPVPVPAPTVVTPAAEPVTLPIVAPTPVDLKQPPPPEPSIPTATAPETVTPAAVAIGPVEVKASSKKKKKNRIPGAPTNTEDLVEAMDADADMEIRGGGMDMAQVRAEQEQLPQPKQFALKDLLKLTYEKGREALFMAMSEARFDIQSIMFYGNLMVRMADLKRKREADDHAARVKAEASGQKWHGVSHDQQFEGRMILHRKRATDPNRKWTSFEDYDVDLDKTLPQGYIPKDLHDIIPHALKYGKDPILYLMSKMGHQKEDLLTIDLAIDAYDVMLEDEHTQLTKQRQQLGLPPLPPRQRILNIAAAPPSAAPAAIAAAAAATSAHHVSSARPLSAMGGGHALGGGHSLTGSGGGNTSGGNDGTSTTRSRPLPAGLGLPRLARGISASSAAMTSSSVASSSSASSSANESTSVATSTSTTPSVPVPPPPSTTDNRATSVAPSLPPASSLPAATTVTPPVPLPSQPPADDQPLIALSINVTHGDGDDNTPAVSLRITPVTIAAKKKAVSAEMVDQISKRLQAQRHQSSMNDLNHMMSGGGGMMMDPYEDMLRQQINGGMGAPFGGYPSGTPMGSMGGGMPMGGQGHHMTTPQQQQQQPRAPQPQPQPTRPMGGIHSLSSSSTTATPEPKRQFAPHPMPPANTGTTLSGNRATPSAAPSPVVPTIDPQSVITLDSDEKKQTKIAIRLLAGRRVVGKFNLTSTIGDLRRFVDAASGTGAPSYRLFNSMPKKELVDNDCTISKAGLANGTVLQEMVR